MASYMVDHWGMEVTPAARAEVAALALPDWMPLATRIESLKVASGSSRRIDFENSGLALDGVAKLVSVSQPKRGQLVRGTDGIYTYTPAAGALLEDEFEVVYESSAGNQQAFKIPVQIVEPRGLMIERFNGIDGDKVTALRSHETYPANPSRTDYLLDFKTPLNSGDNYGIRVRGYITVPTSGEYRFYIASDDGSELWLSPTKLPEDAIKIAGLDGWTDPETYDTQTSQASPLVSLQANQFYYVEALMKEGGGGDHLSVAWTGPGISTPEIINQERLVAFGVDLNQVGSIDPSVALSIDKVAITESQGTAVITAALSQVNVNPVTVQLSIGGTSTPGLDHNLEQNAVIVIPAGQLEGTLTLSVTPDQTGELDETITFTIDSVTNGIPVTPQQVFITILDDDAPPLDFGDAAEPYPVTLEQNGARHEIGSLYLGSGVSAEEDGTASERADGDVDDDGVVAITTLISASMATTSSFLVYASRPGKLDGWIDFNRDGDWFDAGEQVLASEGVIAGENLVSFDVPPALPGVASGDTFMRFRLSSAGSLTPLGLAADGEVEDYVAPLLIGSSSTPLEINTPGGDTTVLVDGVNLVVKQGSLVITQVPFSSFGNLKLHGNSLDDVLQLTILQALSLRTLEFDGDLGIDFLELIEAGQTLDLTNAKITLRDIEGIDLTGTGNNKLVISINAVKEASSTTDTLRVVSNSGDAITFGMGWRAGTPQFINGQFTHVVTESAVAGTARVEILNDRPATNPLNQFDVDRDGDIQPIDALRIINEISRRGSRPVLFPTTDAELGRLYFDVSGDMQINAADALRVINAFARLNRASTASGEGASANVIASPDRLLAQRSTTLEGRPTDPMAPLPSPGAVRKTALFVIAETHIDSESADEFFMGYSELASTQKVSDLQGLPANE